MDERTTHPRGLCDRCAHVQLVRSGRGSTFVMCGRAKTDPRFAKYPPLPVGACVGFEPTAPADPTDDHGRT